MTSLIVGHINRYFLMSNEARERYLCGIAAGVCRCPKLLRARLYDLSTQVIRSGVRTINWRGVSLYSQKLHVLAVIARIQIYSVIYADGIVHSNHEQYTN